MPRIIGVDRVKPEHDKNYIINGDMRIFQRGNTSSFAAIASNIYAIDRFVYGKTGAMVHTLTQDTDVPTVVQSSHLFQNSLRLNLTTPDTSIAAGDFSVIAQYVEGYNFAKLAQKPFTMSFWIKATTTGTYCVAFQNSAADRSFVKEFTVNATNTWEYKTISVSASPSAGTWDYANGIGLKVFFTLAAGTTFQTTAGAWQTGNFLATSSQVNGVNTGATDFRITGIMLNEGIVAAPFKLFGEDIESELSACLRYCFHSQTINDSSFQRFMSSGQASSTVNFSSNIMFPVTMRASASYTQFGSSGITWSAANGTETTAVSVVLNSGPSRTGASIGIVVSSGLVAGNAVQHFISGTAWVFTAEL